MPTYTFQGYKGRGAHRFTCPCCGKPNRVRTFTVEHTVNPFNKNPDGSIRTASEVSANAHNAARTERDQFAKEPLCATCENSLSWQELRALNDRRKAPNQDTEGSE